jgi:hypothetical protein
MVAIYFSNLKRFVDAITPFWLDNIRECFHKALLGYMLRT